ncbi:DUF3575 domain-containing protein [Leptobacterium flavescens]|uniref:DUF3575 domain-containing protein n=1 Tax=Leptobacterium flavescens TaxID=472055 RepID=A0A6P0UR45_9FLAO|nr:DUF3575 domain-containing protein [Leptobacterium flavescens]NER14478.1 DUF3575 domain-containing protein [Leptobacterium flavescens]
MKKIAFLVFMATSVVLHAQDAETFKKNELKINALTTVTIGAEVSYERLLNASSAVGLSGFLQYDNGDFNINYSITPYYRIYFGKKPAAGFFAEGFASFNTVDNRVRAGGGFARRGEILDLALGFGLGVKLITTKNFLVEFNAGVGRNLFNSDNGGDKFVPRGGITTGFRF